MTVSPPSFMISPYLLDKTSTNVDLLGSYESTFTSDGIPCATNFVEDTGNKQLTFPGVTPAPWSILRLAINDIRFVISSESMLTFSVRKNNAIFAFVKIRVASFSRIGFTEGVVPLTTNVCANGVTLIETAGAAFVNAGSRRIGRKAVLAFVDRNSLLDGGVGGL
eukprot:CAMPEP_0178963292 /NCGR_PEP_ID=MMETSP0789-20121207/14931_1 /TAXON_ID=3005 /ORGANISM="Rhizosolenia setigera, Strain CCMP 1694" /LENGTH=164 /DNA_ID=CAMNT_0020647721 /DNA_START=305 /DNA_END=799 /DNA_ORIENTATION=+